MSAAPDLGALSVTVRAPAKINLFLGVGPVRDDGFHPLDTVYQAISLYDDVRVSDAHDWSVSVAAVGDAVDVSGVPVDDDNIAIRAGKLLVAHHGIERSAQIEIAKGIPVAGGMAGGSADAAATLVALDRLWNLATTDDDLLALAAQLGSDVPFALVGGTAHGTGRGELVEPLADPLTWWWVVVPNAEGLSTPAVYRAFDGLPAPSHGLEGTHLVRALETHDLREAAMTLANDLEPAALSLRPDLAAAAGAIRTAGALLTQLSGSGPTYLGLVGTQEQAFRVRENLLDAGYPAVVATGPVARAHVVEYA